MSERNVAVVGFAHAPHVRRTDGTTNGVEMLMPCFAQLYEDLNITKGDIGFWCSGSSDYLAGRAFSFISAIDSIGAVPPINESHVEMDAAWALYEAYIKILTGEVDTALVYGFGKSSAGILRQILSRQTDPYTVAPLWPDSVSMAGLQARIGLDSGKWTEWQMARVAFDSFANAGRVDSEKPSVNLDELLERPFFADPLRRHDIAPITDGAAAVVLAADDRARELRENPAWITGIEHRIETPVLGARDLTESPSTSGLGQDSHRWQYRKPRRRRDPRTVHPPAPDPRGSHADTGEDEGQPVGRRAGGQPDVRRRSRAHRLCGTTHLERLRTSGAGARHQRACAATEPGGGHGRKELMAGAGAHLAAVLGTGQTKYVAKRKDVSMNGLVREAIDRALEDSGSTFDDIDAVVVGKAPDFFEGVMMPELFMADAVGATGKPLIRVHTAGSVGGSTAIVAASLVQSGKYRRVLAMAWEKQSESNAMWALSIPIPFIKPVGAGAGGYFAPHVRSYIRRSGAPLNIGAIVAVKDRLNGARNPLAHLQQSDITVEKVMESPMLWDPIRYDETCPSSDGAAAMVIGNEESAEARLAQGHPVAWIHATALRTEPLQFSGRDQVSPQASRDAAAALWKAAGITSPIDEIDAAEIYVPFSWFEPMWLESLGFAAEGEGWKLTEAGETKIGGRLPVNPSGGVLSSNPIGASGLIRFAESAIQVMGKGGDHQVPGARKALGHAYGGGSQYFSMWVVSSDKPEKANT